MPFTHWVLPLKAQCDSSEEIALTDEHMTMLKPWFIKFRGANPDNQDKIIKEAANCIQRTWTEDTEFDQDSMINVCDLSANLNYAQIFLAYYQTFLWEH